MTDADGRESRIVERTVKALSADAFSESSLVSGESLEEATPSEIQEGWNFVTDLHGDFVRIEEISQGTDSNEITATLELENASMQMVLRFDPAAEELTACRLSQETTIWEKLQLVTGVCKDKANQIRRALFAEEPELTDAESYVQRSRELLEHCRAGEFERVYEAFPPAEQSQLDVDHVQQSWNRYIDDVEAVLDSTHDEQAGLTTITFEAASGRFVWETELTETGRLTHWFIRQAGADEADYASPGYDRPQSYSLERIGVRRNGTDVTRNGADVTGNGTDVTGKVTVPDGHENPPLAVFCQGSGVHDADGTVGGTKLFRDLAVGLAASGIASVRTEKERPADRSRHTVQNVYVPLVDHAVDAAREQAGVEPSQVFLVGHSMGGHLAGEIARLASTSVDGIVALSAPARRIDEVVADQVAYVREYTGPVSEEGQEDIREAKAIAETVRTAAEDELVFDLPVAFWRELLDHAAVESVTSAAPALVVCGERDWRLTDADVAAWRDNADDGLRVRTFEQLDHLLMETESADDPTPGREAANVHPAVIREIAEWIAAEEA